MKAVRYHQLYARFSAIFVYARISATLYARISVILAAACLAITSSFCNAQAWKPDRTVEIVVGSAAGGGNDKTARVMQKIWQDTKLLENSAVVNKVGGGGSLAYTYTNQRPGDANTVAVARTGLLSNYILGLSNINYTDLTPLAIVGDEPMSLTVKADSPIKSVKDLVARWKTDPQSVSISLGSSRGSTTQFVLARIAKLAGVDPRKLKVVTFSGGADSVTNLLGGHIDMLSLGLGNVLEHHKAGTMRVIAVATANRSPELPDVPTLREQGYDVVVPAWTAIMGPKGLSAAQIAYWENVLEQSVAQPQWKRSLEQDSIQPLFMKSKAARDYLAKDFENVKSSLIDLGMIKQ